jgi:hypothetical protein
MSAALCGTIRPGHTARPRAALDLCPLVDASDDESSRRELLEHLMITAKLATRSSAISAGPSHQRASL